MPEPGRPPGFRRVWRWAIGSRDTRRAALEPIRRRPDLDGSYWKGSPGAAVQSGRPVGRIMAANERVSLLELKVELARFLRRDERSELAGISLPVVAIDEGQLELGNLLATHNAFGATVLDGLVMNMLGIGEHAGIQLLGPGD